MDKNHKITSSDLLKIFRCNPREAPEGFRSRLNRVNTQHREADPDELKEFLVDTYELPNDFDSGFFPDDLSGFDSDVWQFILENISESDYDDNGADGIETDWYIYRS